MILKQVNKIEVAYNGRIFILECPPDTSFIEANSACLEIMMQIKQRENLYIEEQNKKQEIKEQAQPEVVSNEISEVPSVEEVKQDIAPVGDHAA